jgi:small subunit ribosomal protein S5
MRTKQEDGLQEEVLHIRRVSRKVPGGNYVSFSALVAVGDGKGGLGIGLAKALEVPKAINKALAKAKKRIVSIKLNKTTIPYDLIIKYNATKLLLKPAPEGTGLKVGSVVRPLMVLSGIKDLSGKIYGSNNKINLTYAVHSYFKKLAKEQKNG